MRPYCPIGRVKVRVETFAHGTTYVSIPKAWFRKRGNLELILFGLPFTVRNTGQRTRDRWPIFEEIVRNG